MKEETIKIQQSSSSRSKLGNLIFSVPYVSSLDGCNVIIGQAGLPNVNRKLNLGDAILYETAADGILEIRLMEAYAGSATFLISQLLPSRGLSAGLINEDPSNLLFSAAERSRIAESLRLLNDDVSKSSQFTAEQLDLISRKMQEIQSASKRLGRKDWINYVAGTITTLCISAAFAPDQAKAIFNALNSAFSWLVSHPPVFLAL